MKEPKTYIINMGAEAGFWGRPKEKIWDAEITLVSKEDYDALQSENAKLREALERAERCNAEGINALVRGFIGNAEVDFRDSQKYIREALKGKE